MEIKVKIGEVTKKITRVPDKDRAMMDITVKIISGIVPMDLEEGEVEVEVEGLGLTILITVGNPLIKLLNVEEKEIKTGDKAVDIICSIVSNKHMTKIITHLKGNIIIWHSLRANHKI